MDEAEPDHHLYISGGQWNLHAGSDGEILPAWVHYWSKVIFIVVLVKIDIRTTDNLFLVAGLLRQISRDRRAGGRLFHPVPERVGWNIGTWHCIVEWGHWIQLRRAREGGIRW